MVVGFSACYFPQIIKLYQTKSSNDISVHQYYLTIAAYVAAMGYMFTTGFGWWWFFNYTTGIGLCLWIIYLCSKYKS